MFSYIEFGSGRERPRALPALHLPSQTHQRRPISAEGWAPKSGSSLAARVGHAGSLLTAWDEIPALVLRKLFCKLSAGRLQLSLITDFASLPPSLAPPKQAGKLILSIALKVWTHAINSSLATHVQNTLKKKKTTKTNNKAHSLFC